MQQPIWHGLSAEEHEAQYNPQRSVPDFMAYGARREAPNERARVLRRHADVAFGPGALHKLDIYPADRPQAPVHIFLHGGYWRGQDKQNFAFVASELVPRGITTVVANYDLCPAVTLDGTVSSALASIEWTARNIATYGGDPALITVSGHSAGAHLSAAALATDWSARGLPHDLLKGGVLISGVYDPAPAALTTVNAEIRLTDEIAARHNYERITPLARCPVWLVAGAAEPWHWIDQTYRYAHHLHRHGRSPGVIVVPQRHHFDIIDQYLDPASDIIRCILGLAGKS